jgi:CheY-like chemotaxis protein
LRKSTLVGKEYQNVMAQIGLLEDNSRIAKLCATILQYAGHRVFVYEHPQACLDALLPTPVPRSNKQVNVVPGSQHVDVLILDLHLPDITGLDVLRSLSAHPTTQSLPLICCTAATMAEISTAHSIAPNACFIEKPFTYQDLVSAVASVLGLPNG